MHDRKDVIELERVPGRFTRNLPGLEEFSFGSGERLDRLSLFFLE